MIALRGEWVWPDNDGVPSIHSIGAGLGRIARFAGQTREWYPVLAHTLVVTRLVAPRYRLHALMHDAAESVVGDVPTTWKTKAAKELESKLLDRIYAHHGLARPTGQALLAVREADERALVAEAYVLGHGDPSWFDAHIRPPDEQALELTRDALSGCRRYLDAEAAGQAFAHFFAILGGHQQTSLAA